MTALFAVLGVLRRNLSFEMVIGLAAVVALAVLLSVTGYRIKRVGAERDAALAQVAQLRTEKELLRTQHEKALALAEAQQALFDAKYRAMEAQMIAKERTADASLFTAKDRNAAAAAAHRSADDSLRDALARAWAAASAASSAADSATAEWRERATSCANLLVDGLRVQGTLAEGAEARSAEVRRMLTRERNVTCGGN